MAEIQSQAIVGLHLGERSLVRIIMFIITVFV
jgi:hypothetical protein